MKDDLELYGDPNIASKDAKVPLWLKLTYFSLPIWGVIWFLLYWNGMHGLLDPGSWHKLEQAANTTYKVGSSYSNTKEK